MRRTIKYLRIVFAFLILFCTYFLKAQDASSIVQLADQKMRGNSMEAFITIRVVRPTWTRSMDVKVWIKGKDVSMILIQNPARDRGIVYLRRKQEVWNWIPVLERSIKLPPSMMSQSWMGTDFTNDDLVKESSVVRDYEHHLLGDTLIRGRNCYIIQMIPKPFAAVVWGKLLVCIDKQDLIEMHSRFYDESGKLVNTMDSYDIKFMDGRLIPTRFVMIPATKSGQSTEMIYRMLRYNIPISDGFFSVEQMKTIK